MSIAANIRNNEHLPETAERATLEEAGNDFLLAPARSDRVAFNALTKPAQGSTPHLVGTPSKKLGLWNGVHLAEMDGSESLHFERRWRLPLSYRSIEVLAIFFDALIIVSAGVLADAAYRVTTTALASEITIYGGAAAIDDDFVAGVCDRPVAMKADTARTTLSIATIASRRTAVAPAIT